MSHNFMIYVLYACTGAIYKTPRTLVQPRAGVVKLEHIDIPLKTHYIYERQAYQVCTLRYMTRSYLSKSSTAQFLSIYITLRSLHAKK